MRYRLTDKLIPQDGQEIPAEGEIFVEILGREAGKSYPGFAENRALQRGLEHARYCKAELLPDCVAGTFRLPRKTDLLGQAISFAYYLDRQRVLFFDDTGTAEKILQELEPFPLADSGSTARFFFEFLELLIQGDSAFLQKFEERMNSLEDRLLDSEVKDFDNKLHFFRRGLLQLGSYYSQLSDLADALSDNRNGLFTEGDCRAFQLFSNRVSRLSAHTRTLREYSLQLHEIYQSKLDARENKIMQFLTVVTTLFLPLSLVAGWYGMNFSDMPELRFPYAYPIVIAVSVLIIVAEIIYFKRKKWFK